MYTIVAFYAVLYRCDKLIKMNKICNIFRYKQPYNTDSFLRTLSVKERLLCQSGENDMHNASSIIFMSSKFKLREDLIHQSLTRITKRQPLLYAYVVKTNNDFYWKKMDKINIDFTTTKSTKWREICSDIVHYKHDLERGPLWRMVYFPDLVSEYEDPDFPFHSAFVFNANHAIIDAQGKVVMVKFINA